MPRSLIIQLLVLCILFAGVGFVYLQSLTRARFETGHTIGYHDQGMSVVHYGIAKYGGGKDMLDYLVFELVEKTQPDLRIIATPETGLFTQEPAYRLRTADGRHRPVPINPDDTSGEVFVADPNGQLNPANISVTLEEWNQYFSHYRQVGDGSLSAENLREFLESPTPDTASTAQAD